MLKRPSDIHIDLITQQKNEFSLDTINNFQQILTYTYQSLTLQL